MSDAGNWVTINGQHVLIGADGVVQSGPRGLVGKKLAGRKPDAAAGRPQSRTTPDQAAARKAAKTVPDTPSEKSALAKQTSRRVAADVQKYSEEHVERVVADGVGGVSLPDSEPADVTVAADAATSRRWRAERVRYDRETAAWKAGGERGARPRPMDLSGDVGHGVEVKTMTDNKQGKVYLKSTAKNAAGDRIDAVQHKRDWQARRGGHYHTVVIDAQKAFNAGGDGIHDDSKWRIYYRRGVASSMTVKTMHEVKDFAELRRVMNTPTDQLPAGARPTTAYREPRARKVGKAA